MYYDAFLRAITDAARRARRAAEAEQEASESLRTALATLKETLPAGIVLPDNLDEAARFVLDGSQEGFLAKLEAWWDEACQRTNLYSKAALACRYASDR